MKLINLLFLFMCGFGVTSTALAAKPIEKNITELGPEAKEQVNNQDNRIWQYFSAGFLTNFYSDEIIESAEIRGGKVRVNDSKKIQFGLGLQAFYPSIQRTIVTSYDNEVTWKKTSEYAIGPYAGVMLGGDGKVIDSFSMGIALSQRREDIGFRFGVGVVFLPDAQVLAEDFVDGMPAPIGETQVRFREKTLVGIQAMLTFTQGW